MLSAPRQCRPCSGKPSRQRFEQTLLPMHAPLPDTPEKVWSRVIKLGAGADGLMRSVPAKTRRQSVRHTKCVRPRKSGS